MSRLLLKDAQVFTALVFVCITMCSCSIVNNDFPDINLPFYQMNKVIQINDLPEFGNTHRNNDILILQVLNTSDRNIVFEYQSCFLVFAKSGDEWLTVENSMHYPSEIRTLPPNNIFAGGIHLVLSPIIRDMVDKQEIRIIILGHYENAEDQLLGAFLDITLLP